MRPELRDIDTYRARLRDPELGLREAETLVARHIEASNVAFAFDAGGYSDGLMALTPLLREAAQP